MMAAHAAKLESWRRAAGATCVKSGHYGRSRCHNQLVLDASAWSAALPDTFEAFFYQSKSTADSVEWARTLHADFLRSYGLDARAMPLVIYDEESTDAPFALATG